MNYSGRGGRVDLCPLGCAVSMLIRIYSLLVAHVSGHEQCLADDCLTLTISPMQRQCQL